MNDVTKNIVIRAINVRIKRGESIDDILASYPKLTKEEKNELKEMFIDNK